MANTDNTFATIVVDSFERNGQQFLYQSTKSVTATTGILTSGNLTVAMLLHCCISVTDRFCDVSIKC